MAECSSSQRSFWSREEAASSAWARCVGDFVRSIQGTRVQSAAAAGGVRTSWTPGATTTTTISSATSSALFACVDPVTGR
ncbi:hypothetical protein Vau01_093260 [Virgisporangium aurantiacum]|uniref:Uncharacterized protein n=1 Tax=Virgisporangium aurantiacum TaxID=175570 RepID=A0A8J4E4C6_9ACTN|nr:hypothetical protein Vau01_093260 [Virgisporangium aurantiacum]